MQLVVCFTYRCAFIGDIRIGALLLTGFFLQLSALLRIAVLVYSVVDGPCASNNE